MQRPSKDPPASEAGHWCKLRRVTVLHRYCGKEEEGLPKQGLGAFSRWILGCYVGARPRSAAHLGTLCPGPDRIVTHGAGGQCVPDTEMKVCATERHQTQDEDKGKTTALSRTPSTEGRKKRRRKRTGRRKLSSCFSLDFVFQIIVDFRAVVRNNSESILSILPKPHTSQYLPIFHF